MLLEEIGYLMIGAAAALTVALLVMIGRHLRWSDLWRYPSAVLWWLWCWLPQCVFALMIIGMIIAAIGDAPPLAVTTALLPALLGSSLLAAIGRQAKWARDRGLADRLLMHLQRALRLNAPLSPWMRAAARDEREPFRGVMIELADALDAGQPVGPALVAVVPSFDLRTSNLLSSADSLGRLPAMMRQVVEQQRRDERTLLRTSAMGFGWVFVSCVAMAIAITGVLIFILPKFGKIFEDFDAPPPPFFAHLFEPEPMDVLPPPGQLLLLGMLACLGIAWLLGTHVGRGHIPRGLIQLLRDALVWAMPPLRQIDRDHGLGDVCLLLSQATLGHVPLSTAARHACFLPINEKLRRQVTEWSDLQTQGFLPAAAARVAGLPQYLQQMLALAHGSDSLPQALTMLAEHYHERAVIRLRIIRQSLVYSAYVVIAFLTACFAWWLFQSLVTLIWSCIHQSLTY
jgi:type II secretory pathway component PulF